MNVKLLSAGLHVSVVGGDRYRGLNLDTDTPVFITAVIAQPCFHVVLLSANQRNPEGEGLADLLVLGHVSACVAIVSVVEVAVGGPFAAFHNLL